MTEPTTDRCCHVSPTLFRSTRLPPRASARRPACAARSATGVAAKAHIHALASTPDRTCRRTLLSACIFLLLVASFACDHVQTDGHVAILGSRPEGVIFTAAVRLVPWWRTPNHDSPHTIFGATFQLFDASLDIFE